MGPARPGPVRPTRTIKHLVDRERIVSPITASRSPLREPPLPTRRVLPVLLSAPDCHRCPPVAITVRMCAITTVPKKKFHR